MKPKPGQIWVRRDDGAFPLVEVIAMADLLGIPAVALDGDLDGNLYVLVKLVSSFVADYEYVGEVD